ncbi:MAG: lytic murein transglycosylase [Candidatus Parcubacteria bacterium]|nr:lytic murein transglycosylase [Candidatus Parcubacteria bacterium]
MTMPSLHKLWIRIMFIAIISLLLFSQEQESLPQKPYTIEAYPTTVLSKNTFPELPNISYEEIIKFAKNASKETGVRPEFLAAIISQESSEGKNVGSCFLFDPKLFGSGVGINLFSGTFTSKIMKPDRDVEPFFKIMEELDRSPFFTPVSCPMKTGWGGAMGPMQIIPSTWILVKDRTAIALRKKMVDPWVPEDAFMAAAIHLKDLGADHGKVSSERTAACKYFSGKPCGEKKLILTKKTKHGKRIYKKAYVENPIIAQYGDSVMKKMRYFQKIFHPPVVLDIKAKQKTRNTHKK